MALAATSVKRIDEFEALRGLLASWVMVSHLIGAAGLASEGWVGPLRLLGRGMPAVEMFIILSGFVIFLLLDTAREDYRTFIVRRFLRLYPVYIVCLLAAVSLIDARLWGLEHMPWADVRHASRIDLVEGGKEDLLAHLLAHLSLLHGAIPDDLLPAAPWTLLGAAWSISLEWQFYLVAPLLYALLSRGRVVPVTLTLAAIALVHRRFSGEAAFLPTQLPLFLAGIGSYFLWKHREAWLAVPGLRPEWLMPAAGIGAMMWTGSIPLAFWAAVLMGVIAFRTGGGSVLDRGLGRLLTLTPIRALGRISYPVYLVHGVVSVAVIRVSIGAFGPDDGWRYFAFLLATVVPATLVVSEILHRLMERPFIDLGRSLAARWRRPAATVGAVAGPAEAALPAEPPLRAER